MGGKIRYTTTRSETVDLDGALRDALLNKECGDLQPLVALQLDDLSSLLILNESTVAGEFLWPVLLATATSIYLEGHSTYLLECLEELLGVVLYRSGSEPISDSDSGRDKRGDAATALRNPSTDPWAGLAA